MNSPGTIAVSPARAQGESSDVAMWGALRALQEQEFLLRTVLAQLRAEGDHAVCARVEARMREMAQQAELLRGLLEQMPKPYE